MRKAWGVACSQLKEMLATPEQVAERADVYRKRWPTMPLTVNALAKHWLDLDPQANISLMPPQRVATFAPVAEPRRKTPRYFEDVYGSGAAR